MTRCAVFFLVAICFGSVAQAQDLSPRAYLITPAGSNAAVLAYAHQSGSLVFDGASPVSGATAVINLPILSYYRSFGFLGHSANVTASLPYGFGDFQGTIADVPRELSKSGLLDSSLRVAVNLLGGPAMSPSDFVKWQQGSLLGLSLKVIAPTGQYDPTKVINWGSNRWAFKPEIGYSRRLSHWVIDAYVGAGFTPRTRSILPAN